MTKDEALKLALEALEYHTAQRGPIHETYEAITTIKAALAKPVQEPYDQTALELCNVCGWKTLIPDDGCLNCERDALKAAIAQEPVGWQSIETAPKDGTGVLVYCQKSLTVTVTGGYWDDHPQCRCWIAGGYMQKVFPPTHWMPLPPSPDKTLAQPAQEPSAMRPCRSCGGTGDRDTGIPESPIATCKPCNGTGQIALTQPAQKPVAWCWIGRKGWTEYGPIPHDTYPSKPLYAVPLPTQPAQEPVARVSGTYGGRFVYEPVNRAAILPVGMALYSSPQGNT